MTATDTKPVVTTTDTTEPPLLHLVLQADWPIALCGENVSERFTNRAAGLDRCPRCLAIASQRQLGRPGWH